MTPKVNGLEALAGVVAASAWEIFPAHRHPSSIANFKNPLNLTPSTTLLQLYYNYIDWSRRKPSDTTAFASLSDNIHIILGRPAYLSTRQQLASIYIRSGPPRSKGMSLKEHPAISPPADYGQTAPPTVATMSPSTSTTASPLTTMHNPTAHTTAFERWAARASESQFNALSGAVGGFTSGVVTCPLDVIKTKLQAQGGLAHLNSGRHVGQAKMYNGLAGTAKVIWKDEGLRGMYRGLGPIILGYLPTWAVWFTVYNKSKRELSPYSGMYEMAPPYAPWCLSTLIS